MKGKVIEQERPEDDLKAKRWRLEKKIKTKGNHQILEWETDQPEVCVEKD